MVQYTPWYACIEQKSNAARKHAYKFNNE